MLTAIICILLSGYGNEPSFVQNAIDVSVVRLKNLLKFTGHVGFVLDSIIAPVLAKKGSFVLHVKNGHLKKA